MGIYCFRADLFWKHVDEIRPDNPAREYYLTDIAEILTRAGHRVEAMQIDDAHEALGINTRVELAAVDRLLRDRKVRELMLAGVTIEKPETVTIDPGVAIGMDTVVEPFAQHPGPHHDRRKLPHRTLRDRAGFRDRRRRGDRLVQHHRRLAAGARRDRRAVRAAASGQPRRSGGAHRQFRRAEKDAPGRRLQGQSPGVSGGLGNRRQGQHRRRHHHLQLRRIPQASDADRRGRVHRQQFDAGSADRNRRRALMWRRDR